MRLIIRRFPLEGGRQVCRVHFLYYPSGPTAAHTLQLMKRYGQFCPIAKASEVLGERWTHLVIRELGAGSDTFNDLRKGLPLMSPSPCCRQRLKSLEERRRGQNGKQDQCGCALHTVRKPESRTERRSFWPWAPGGIAGCAANWTRATSTPRYSCGISTGQPERRVLWYPGARSCCSSSATTPPNSNTGG